ncbi:MAG TPA: MFS transporter [Burkholderiales bacterium]|nr:MFS transporter [Burkholderiales bacterium]
MEIAYFIFLNVAGHLCFVGSRMTTTLFALQLGASELTAGMLLALFAVLPMLLSVSAGRIIDRLGPKRPVMAGLALLAVAATLPFLYPSLTTLYISSPLLGSSFMFLHIAMNSVFGAYATPANRAVVFSWLSLGFSISNSIGPLIAGYAIEGFGHAGAMLALAVFPVIAFFMLWRRKRPLPRPERVRERGAGVLDLLRVPTLRHTLIASGLLNMAWDIYSFLMPLYGHRIGLTAATIGIVMSTFALATFTVRAILTQLVRHVRHWVLIGSAMALAGTAYLLFPFVNSVALLIALSFTLGLGLGASQPVIMALLYDASPPGRQGEAVGIRTTMMNGSQTFIPLASGAISAALGMTPVFALIAFALFTGAWLARQRIK